MEQFFHNNSIFIVLTIAIMILIGLTIYLFAIDRKIAKLEKYQNEELYSENE